MRRELQADIIIDRAYTYLADISQLVILRTHDSGIIDCD